MLNNTADRVRFHRHAAREDRFRIVTGTAFGQHDLSWIRQHAPDDGSVTVEDVTSLCLPRHLGAARRDILQPLSTADLSNDAFRYMRAREIDVGPVPCLALRVTYVGELGWELYCPMEFGLRLWDTIWDAGRDHGLVAGGYKAIDSCRLEGLPRVGRGHHPRGQSARLGSVRGQARQGGLHRPRRARPGARARAKARVPGARRCARCRASEPVRIEGERSGASRGGYGYTVERSIAYAYVPAVNAEPGRRVEVEVFGEWISGEIAREPLYDPDGSRIRT